MNAKCLSGILVMITVASVHAQLSLEATYRSTGKAMMAAFEPQREVLQKCSAVIQQGRNEAGYGTVISEDGYILTKASVFEKLSKPSVIVDRKKYEDVQVFGIDPAWDVVLIKIDAKNLKPVTYAPTSKVSAGTWIVGNGVTSRIKRRVLMGVVSANIREVPAEGGLAIGVKLKEGEALEIVEVNEKGGAHEAGLKKGDVILKMDGKEVKTTEDMVEILKEKEAGIKIPVDYRRGDEELQTDVLLLSKKELFGGRMSRNDMMSGQFSKRRSGFPRVLQHTILGAKNTVGGPLLDLNGRCLGMNIARANRAESFAIPVEDVKEIAERLVAKAEADSN